MTLLRTFVNRTKEVNCLKNRTEKAEKQGAGTFFLDRGIWGTACKFGIVYNKFLYKKRFMVYYYNGVSNWKENMMTT